MKAILIVEMPKKCIDCPLVYKEDHFIYRCKVSEDQVDPNGIYCDCPLRPSRDYIPIGYIEAFKKEVRDVANGKAVIEWLLEEWEKEK